MEWGKRERRKERKEKKKEDKHKLFTLELMKVQKPSPLSHHRGGARSLGERTSARHSEPGEHLVLLCVVVGFVVCGGRFFCLVAFFGKKYKKFDNG